MKLKDILLKLTLIECELDDATNSLPDWNGNSDSRGNIDGAKDELYNLKDEVISYLIKHKNDIKDNPQYPIFSIPIILSYSIRIVYGRD